MFPFFFVNLDLQPVLFYAKVNFRNTETGIERENNGSLSQRERSPSAARGRGASRLVRPGASVADKAAAPPRVIGETSARRICANAGGTAEGRPFVPEISFGNDGSYFLPAVPDTSM